MYDVMDIIKIKKLLQYIIIAKFFLYAYVLRVFEKLEY